MMNNAPANLRPATTDEITHSLAHGLLWNGRKRTHRGDQLMAQLMAEHLVEYLDLCGYVLMKKPPNEGTNFLNQRRQDGGGDDF